MTVRRLSRSLPDCRCQANLREDYVALLFDQFGVRRVELDVLMWPGFSHGFRAGELSALYGRLNTTDLFDSCELRANVGAEFESEHWSYDISSTAIRLSSTSFQSFEELDKQVLHLIGETKKFLTPRRVPFLIADRVLVRGTIPEDADRDVSETLRSKLLSRRLSRVEEGVRPLDSLPGALAGSGLTLVGDTDDYHWHADVGPAHSGSAALPISATLYFPPPEERPEESMISVRLGTAYDFTTTSVLEFAKTVLS